MINEPTKVQVADREVMHYNDGDWIHFKAVPPVTEEQAKVIQAAIGYMWQGYGFYGFRHTLVSSHWKCGVSCD